MWTINLSKFVLGSHFFDVLEKEGIHYDHVFSDCKFLVRNDYSKKITTPVKNFFKGLNKEDRILIILEKLGIEDLIQFLQGFSNLTVLSTYSWVASFSRKNSPEINYLGDDVVNMFTIYFPWDFVTFLENLRWEGNIFIPLTNQEISETIYSNVSNEEEELQFIEKSLVDNKGCLDIFSPRNSEVFVLGFGNHFEELIKLSHLLLQDSVPISFSILSNWNYLFSEDFKNKIRHFKKIIFILDHESNNQLKSCFNSFSKDIIFIVPFYEKLTSIFIEYQFEQSFFNASALYYRIRECV